ncbi:beta family protein [Microvirga sp. ACRRW]|uniref:beta family protein n=1 Tax=Microvirga sp. ACRRW TaxID=2918205 RepID=UPI001EF5E1B3|nr:beta family protein [Microvirga sp. ACRRW]MCG7392894.1 beta family protein [Microvirga sp. ACRRW]
MNSQSRSYFPCFSTSPFELRAYLECSDQVKDSMTPIVTLTRQRGAATIEDSFEVLGNAAGGRRMIVDFDAAPKTVATAAEAAERRRQRARAREELGLKPTRPRSERELARDEEGRRATEAFNAHIGGLEGSASWISLALKWQGMIPIVRLGSQESVAVQIRAAARSSSPLAFRVAADDERTLQLAARGIAQMTDPSGSVLIVDGGYVRSSIRDAANRIDQALRSMQAQLGEAFHTIDKVVVSGSFPTTSLRDFPRMLAMDEHDVFASVNGTWDVRYGDHASLPRREPRAGGNGWFPHVDLVLGTSWRIELEESNSDPGAYIRCAATTFKSPEWSRRTDCWGTSVIEQVAQGDLRVNGAKFGAPAPWISVRVNQHITRMAGGR